MIFFLGNKNSITTDFDVTMWMEGDELELIVPNPPYENGVEGLCGNNNGEETDDYTTREGVVLPYTPGVGFITSDSEYQTGESWIMRTEELSTLMRQRRAAEPLSLILPDSEDFDIVRNFKLFF